jgi:acetylornithine deacetylase
MFSVLELCELNTINAPFSPPETRIMDVKPDLHYLTQQLTSLVQINSVNPGLWKEGAGEAEIADYLGQAMGELGMEIHLDEVAPGRNNAVGILKGTGGGRSIMWNGHLDTVGPNGMSQPFKVQIRDGKLYGRGSQDMKGSLAAMLCAVRAIQEAGIRLKGDIILAGVADEELASLGTEHLVRHYQAQAAIVTEPTELRLCLAHRGFIAYAIETTGRAAHGSRYDEGIDAIMHMGRFLSELDGLEKELRQRSPHPLVGPPSLHASIIQGGTEYSTYPAHCHLEFERRTCPGETTETVTGEVRSILDRLATADPKFKYALSSSLTRPPFEVDPGAAIVQSSARALFQQTGEAAKLYGVPFWTDAALLSEAGIPTVLLGPTGHGLHSAEEWVDLQSCLDLASILAEVAIDFCES